MHETFWAEPETNSRPMFPRRDQDVQSFDWDETFKIRDETLQFLRRWSRPWSSRDSWKSRELQRLAETFSVMYNEIHWQGKQVIWAKLMRRATALAVIIRRLSWFNSIHFVAIHSWNLRRSHKSEKNSKIPIFEIQGHSRSSMFTPIKSLLHLLCYIACYDKQHVSADLQPFSSYTSQ